MKFNRGFLTSIQAIIKISEMLSSFFTFVFCSDVENYNRGMGFGWGVFVGVLGFLVALMFFFLYLFTVYPDFFKKFSVESLINVVLAVFFFISGVVAAAQCRWTWHSGSAGIASFFSFLSMVSFTIDAILYFMCPFSSSFSGDPPSSNPYNSNNNAPPQFANVNY